MLPTFRTTHHKLAELEDQFKIASVTMRIVLLLVEEAVTQTLEGSETGVKRVGILLNSSASDFVHST